MSVARVVLVAAAMIVAASAHNHGGSQMMCPTVANNPYRASTCAGYKMCERNLCTCAGTTGMSTTCLSNIPSTVTCMNITTCLRTFAGCLNTLTGARLNTSDPCNNWAVGLHAAILQAALGNYNGSNLQKACWSRACMLVNQTGRTCPLGVNGSAVCSMPNVANTSGPASTPAPTLPPNPVAVIIATLRIQGNFTAILANATARAQLQAALTTDLARVLQILEAFLQITDMRAGSLLIVTMQIFQGSGVSTAALQSRITAAGNSSSWLQSTQAAYTALGGTGTLSVLGFAGVEATTTPAGGIASSASAVSAAAAAVLAAAALLF